jgi:hypothetical protein
MLETCRREAADKRRGIFMTQQTVCPLGALQAFYDAVMRNPEEGYSNNDFCETLAWIVKQASRQPPPTSDAGREILEWAEQDLTSEIKELDPASRRHREAVETLHRVRDLLAGGEFRAARYREEERTFKRRMDKVHRRQERAKTFLSKWGKYPAAARFMPPSRAAAA